MAIIVCSNCGAKNRVDESRRDVQPVCGKCKKPLDLSAAASGTADNGHPIDVTDSTFAGQLQAAGEKPVLVDAWATWCPPCKMIAPTIDQLAAESKGRWVVTKLDVDQSPATAQQFRISSIPTLLIFKRGKLVEQMVGVQPKQAILAKLESHARAT